MFADPRFQKKLERVRTEAERVQNRYKKFNKYRWSDKRFKEMTEKVERLDAYNTIYHLLSNLSHPNPRNMNDYFSESGERLKVNAGPDDRYISESLVATFDFFIHTIDVWNKEFKFGLKSTIETLAKRCGVGVGKLKEGL